MPMWSMCAWVITTASNFSGGSTSGASKYGIHSDSLPGFAPQSTNTRLSLVVTRCIVRPTSRYEPRAVRRTHS